MSDLYAQVRAFVAKERSVRPTRIHPETTLFGDLRIDGDDGVDLLEAFGREFGVDLSELDLTRHFGPEGLELSFPLTWIRLALGKGTPEEKAGLEPVTVADLVRAAEVGRWTYSGAAASQQGNQEEADVDTESDAKGGA